MRPLSSGGPSAPWACGRARLPLENRHRESRFFTGVRVKVAGQDSGFVALLDTGAEWSVIGGELAELVADTVDVAQAPQVRLETRLGSFVGLQVRVEVTLVADQGESLVVDATVLLLPHWPGPTIVVGFGGFLERARIALEPGTANDHWISFGLT